MQLCFLLEKEPNFNNSLLKCKLEKLKDEEVISDYTTIKEEFLGFPLLKPENVRVYRVDNVIIDLDRVIQKYNNGRTNLKTVGSDWWEKINDIGRLNKIRKNFYDSATAFFRSDNIKRWTTELNALNEIDKNFHLNDNPELRNELAYEAFWLIEDCKGYFMVRAVIADGKLPKLEEKLDGKYVRRTINV